MANNSLLDALMGPEQPATLNGGELPLHFGRAEMDGGIPFRGTPGLWKEDEMLLKTHIVHDAHSKVFDMTVPEDVKMLEGVFKRVFDQSVDVLIRDHKWVDGKDGPKVLVFCLWVEAFKESKPPVQ